MNKSVFLTGPREMFFFKFYSKQITFNDKDPTWMTPNLFRYNKTICWLINS